jgi:large subunit ribosomal protein L3
MPVALYGTKVGMTRVYDGDVESAVTVIEVQPNEVVEVKTEDKHGYAALKVAVGQPKNKNKMTKAIAGEYKRADVAPRRFLREIPVVDGVELGGKVTVEALDLEASIDVSSQSKGRGFTGAMKRHNFAGQPDSHGVSKSHRGVGAIGCRMDPGRVFKGKKMPGHYGNDKVTVKNLKIVSVDPERNIVVIRGSVPGPNGGLVNIRQK